MNSKIAWQIFKETGNIIDYLVYVKIKNYESNKNWLNIIRYFWYNTLRGGNMKVKRIAAYIIDMVIVYFISSLFLMIPAFSYDTEKYLDHFEEYTKLLAESEKITDEVIEKQNSLTYKMSYLAKNSLVIQAVVTFAYFGIASFLLKGQTLGKKMLKIKVVRINDKELNPHLYILRSIILTNLIPSIASIIAIFTLKETTWITVESIIGNISIIISFALIFCMIFRNDERSIHDLICQTKVIEVESKA